VIYAICAGLGLLALLVSEVTQAYAFISVFILSGLILFGPTRGTFVRPEELEAESYETHSKAKDRSDTKPRDRTDMKPKDESDNEPRERTIDRREPGSVIGR
jgi:hypothetical protein